MGNTVRYALRARLVCAVLAAVSGFMAYAVEVTAKNYVQNGLIAHWDAIENAGYGVHDGSATVWKDLSSTGFDLTLDTASWKTNALTASGKQAAHGPSSLTYVSMEVLFENEGHSQHVWLFGNGVNRYCVLANNRVQWLNGRAIQTFDYKGTGIHGLSWVNDKAAYLDGVSQTYGDYSDSWGIGANYVVLGSRTGDYNFTGRYHALRLYNRELTAAEVAYNSAMDQIRFQGKTLETVSLPNSWRLDAVANLCDADGAVLVVNPALEYFWTGKAGTADWHTPGNWAYEDGSASAVVPQDCRVIVTGAVVAVSSSVSVKELALNAESGVTVADGAVLSAGIVTRAGVSIGRGIFSGDAMKGYSADWANGAGTVNVAGSENGQVPTVLPQPVADGWYEFGMTKGYSMDEKKGYAGPSDKTTRPFVQAERVDMGTYAFPANAKLRLVGGVLIDTIPADWFSEVDISALKQLTLCERALFADGTPITVPTGVTMRYSPGTWVFHTASNGWYNTVVNAASLTNAVTMAGGTFLVSGNGTHYSNQVWDGDFGGDSGTLKLDNFSNHVTFRGNFSFSGNIPYSSDCGGSVRIFSPHVSGRIGTVTMVSGSGWYDTSSFRATVFAFGPVRGADPADREVRIGTLNGKGTGATYSNGVRVRGDGNLLVWGGNTLHIEKLQNGIHVVGRAKDLDVSNNGTRDIDTFGTGHVVFDAISSGSVFATTNVTLLVGSVAANTVFDYTYHSNAVNRTTLDITNACPSTVRVLATDLAMLPARLSGFAGEVTLTDTEAHAYSIPVDFSVGTTGLYQTVGCIGSGTLAAAPATGSIDATFDTAYSAKPLSRGEYALARFTAGGEKLADWTVTLNGEAVENKVVRGMTVSVRKDSTGIYLAVHRGVTAVIVR